MKQDKNRDKKVKQFKQNNKINIRSRIKIDGDGEIICGRNPVEELLKSGREIECLYVQRGSNSSAEAIANRARKQGIKVSYMDRAALDETSGGIPHQGVLCVTSPYEYADLNHVIRGINDLAQDDQNSKKMPLLILLDGIEDPHNLGAIIRSAECAGAAAVVIPNRRSASVNQTVVKASAGATEYMPCVRVSNIAATIDRLKEEGFWIYACDMDGDSLFDAKLDGKIAIVIGNEGSGVSRLVKEKCDFTISIPMNGKIDSLNASNAAALVMYEVMRKQA